MEDAATDAAPDAANMEVDGHTSTQSQGASAVPLAQMALTPFNHSPVTARGRQIVERARAESPHLVASPPVVSRSSSPSRVRTFMQGRTRPVSSSTATSTLPRSPQDVSVLSSSPTQTEPAQPAAGLVSGSHQGQQPTSPSLHCPLVVSPLLDQAAKVPLAQADASQRV
jgi:hypothetical protein